MELADRDPEPVGGADLDDGVDGERPGVRRHHHAVAPRAQARVREPDPAPLRAWRRAAAPRTATPEARRVRPNGERTTREASDATRLKRRFSLLPLVAPLLQTFVCTDAPQREADMKSARMRVPLDGSALAEVAVVAALDRVEESRQRLSCFVPPRRTRCLGQIPLPRRSPWSVRPRRTWPQSATASPSAGS
jgi:hypothetical protein